MSALWYVWGAVAWLVLGLCQAGMTLARWLRDHPAAGLAVPIQAFVGGLGVGLAVVFVVLLLTLGADLIRSMGSE